VFGTGILLILRVARIYKWLQEESLGDGFQILLDAFLNNLSILFYFSTLLGAICYVSSIFAMDTFAGKLKFDSHDQVDVKNGLSANSNFDTFLNAYSTVFQIIIGENWNYVTAEEARQVHYENRSFMIVCGRWDGVQSSSSLFSLSSFGSC
jgi:hypothetical protein